MHVEARTARPEDLPEVEKLYRMLEEEMTSLHEMWPVADGLPEPVSDALVDALRDPDILLVVGAIDGVTLGFLLARVEGLLPQGGGEKIGSIRLVFVDPAAREVGVGEAMRDLAMEILGSRGVRRFDAHVLPGHRLVKNFFEAGGFSARSIVMHNRGGDRP